MLFRPSLAMYRVSRLVQGIAGPLSSQALSQRTLSLLSATKSISCKSTFNNQALSIFSKYQVSRFYGAAAHLDVKEVEERVLEVLCAFDRVDAKKVTKMSSFTADLGLDSLDAVEVCLLTVDYANIYNIYFLNCN